jgi:hypothetical protein
MEPLDTGLTVREAASRLGISVPAVHKRIRRRSLQARKVAGVWYVVLPADLDASRTTGNGRAGQDASMDAVIVELRERLTEYRERVQFLERLTEYQAGQISELTRRLPELPVGSPPPKMGEFTETPADAPETAATPPGRRPWWRRWFGG